MGQPLPEEPAAQRGVADQQHNKHGDQQHNKHGDVLRDPRFQPFLAEDFDPSAFASRALAQAQSTAQEQAEALQSGIQLLDAQLRHEVLRRRDELVGQASRLGEAEASVQRIALSVRSLQAVAARVRADVGEPYAQIAERTRQLANVQRTVELLRHLTHRLRLMQRLRVQMAAEGAGAHARASAAAALCHPSRPTAAASPGLIR